MTTEAEQHGPSEAADEAAIRAATRMNGNGRGPAVTSYRLANGIVLRLKPVPPLAMRAAAARIPEPVVPKVHLASQDREEDNPNDPGYQAALFQKSIDQTNAMFTVALLIGTEVESIPEGYYGPQQDEWITQMRETLVLVGSEDDVPRVRETPERARYLDWLRLYAVTSDVDLYMLSMMLVQGVALSESEVQAAMASFRDRVRANADIGLSRAETAVDRLVDPPDDAGVRAGIRGETGGEVGRVHVEPMEPSPA